MPRTLQILVIICFAHATEVEHEITAAVKSSKVQSLDGVPPNQCSAQDKAIEEATNQLRAVPVKHPCVRLARD